MRRNLQIAKRRHVRQQFRRFAELCTDVPPGKPHILDGSAYDPPDVCIGDHDLGIEIVEFVHGWKEKTRSDTKSQKGTRGSDIRASERLYDKLVDEARQQFEQQYPVPLHVSIVWLDFAIPKQAEKSELVKALLDVIIRAMPKFDSQPSLGDLEVEIEWDDFADTCLDKYLGSIHISRLTDSESGVWACPRAAYVGFPAKSFEALVRVKEKDLPRYSNQFDSVWLIIVAGTGELSSEAIPDQTVQPGCITSRFDRVYFFNMLRRQIICLTEVKY